MASSVPTGATLAGVWEKVRRARKLFTVLESEVRPWVEAQRPTLAHQGDPQTGWHTWRLRGPGPPPPLQWSVILGEIIHDLRSALDHLVWQLVIANGKSPTKKNQFPIFSGPAAAKDWKDRRNRWTAMLSGVDVDAVRLIKSMQPYRTRDRLTWSPLEMLADFSDTDKHQLLVTSWAGMVPNPAVGSPFLVNPPPAGAVYIEFRGATALRWPLPIDDTEVFALRIEPPTAKPNVEVNTHVGMTVGLGEGQWITLHDLISILEEVESVVRGLGRWMEP